MTVKFNITEIKGKIIDTQGKEIYDPNLKKIIERNMEAVGGIKRNGEAKEAEGENQEK